MRVQNREVKDFSNIIDILSRCDTLSIGLVNDNCPYVVSVSFGFHVDENGKVHIYFHCAKEGMKIECIKANSKVCVEGHIFHKIEPLKHGITTRYESIIGMGTARELYGNEKKEGLLRICEKYGYDDYNIDECKGMDAASVYDVALEKITGKRNLA